MRNILFVFILMIPAGFLFGQEKTRFDIRKFQHSVFVGYNLGGLAPVSFPENIREINSYSPGFSPSFGYELIYMLKKKWGLGTGVRIDWKAMAVRDSVQYFHTQVSVDDASVEGDFSGTNTTKAKNIYLSVPVYAVYRSENNWKFNLGFYFARLIKPSFYGSVSDGYLRKGNSLGEKITIDNATFDFAKEERKTDYGIVAGAAKSVYKNFAVKADLQWGLRPVFPDSFSGISFNMYNIYATLGMSYQF